MGTGLVSSLSALLGGTWSNAGDIAERAAHASNCSDALTVLVGPAVAGQGALCSDSAYSARSPYGGEETWPSLVAAGCSPADVYLYCLASPVGSKEGYFASCPAPTILERLKHELPVLFMTLVFLQLYLACCLGVVLILRRVMCKPPEALQVVDGSSFANRSRKGGHTSAHPEGCSDDDEDDEEANVRQGVSGGVELVTKLAASALQRAGVAPNHGQGSYAPVVATEEEEDGDDIGSAVYERSGVDENTFDEDSGGMGSFLDGPRPED